MNDNIASLASLACSESVSASPTASLTASLKQQTASLALVKEARDETSGEAISEPSEATGEATSEATSEATALTQSRSEASEAIPLVSPQPGYSAEEQHFLSLCETPEQTARTKQIIEGQRAKSTSSLPGQPKSEPRSQPKSRHRDFKVGERVVIARDDNSPYHGAKGTVILVKGYEVTVNFDKRVGFIDFTSFDTRQTDIMKL